MIRRIAYCWLLAVLSFVVSAQDVEDNAKSELIQYVQKVNYYAQYVPQEMVYVHLKSCQIDCLL